MNHRTPNMFYIFSMDDEDRDRPGPLWSVLQQTKIIDVQTFRKDFLHFVLLTIILFLMKMSSVSMAVQHDVWKPLGMYGVTIGQ